MPVETFRMADSCMPLSMPFAMLLVLPSCSPLNLPADILEIPENCTPLPPPVVTDEMTPTCTLFTESCMLTMPTGKFWAQTLLLSKTVNAAIIQLVFLFIFISSLFLFHISLNAVGNILLQVVCLMPICSET